MFLDPKPLALIIRATHNTPLLESRLVPALLDVVAPLLPLDDAATTAAARRRRSSTPPPAPVAAAAAAAAAEARADGGGGWSLVAELQATGTSSSSG